MGPENAAVFERSNSTRFVLTTLGIMTLSNAIGLIDSQDHFAQACTIMVFVGSMVDWVDLDCSCFGSFSNQKQCTFPFYKVEHSERSSRMINGTVLERKKLS